MVLDAAMLNIQQKKKIRIKGKWSNPGIVVVSSSTTWCGSHWKGNLQVTVGHFRPTYIYIYTYKRSLKRSVFFINQYYYMVVILIIYRNQMKFYIF